MIDDTCIAYFWWIGLHHIRGSQQVIALVGHNYIEVDGVPFVHSSRYWRGGERKGKKRKKTKNKQTNKKHLPDSVPCVFKFFITNRLTKQVQSIKANSSSGVMQLHDFKYYMLMLAY